MGITFREGSDAKGVDGDEENFLRDEGMGNDPNQNINLANQRFPKNSKTRKNLIKPFRKTTTSLNILLAIKFNF